LVAGTDLRTIDGDQSHAAAAARHITPLKGRIMNSWRRGDCAAIVVAMAAASLALAGFSPPANVQASDDICDGVLVTWEPARGAIGL
jgi:hypothetical protein